MDAGQLFSWFCSTNTSNCCSPRTKLCTGVPVARTLLPIAGSAFFVITMISPLLSWSLKYFTNTNDILSTTCPEIVTGLDSYLPGSFQYILDRYGLEVIKINPNDCTGNQCEQYRKNYFSHMCSPLYYWELPKILATIANYIEKVFTLRPWGNQNPRRRNIINTYNAPVLFVIS